MDEGLKALFKEISPIKDHGDGEKFELHFMEHYFVNQSQFGIYFFAVVLILFVCAFAMAWAKDVLFRWLKIA